MGEFAFTLPVLQGKRGALEELARTVTVTKKQEFADSRKRLNIDKESWFFESSIRGDSWILYEEGLDASKSFADWIASNDPFDMWFKEQVAMITGIELSIPLPSSPPRQLFKFPP